MRVAAIERGRDAILEQGIGPLHVDDGDTGRRRPSTVARRAGVAAALFASALAFAACGDDGSASPPDGAPGDVDAAADAASDAGVPSIEWIACVPLGFECGTLPVPLSYTDPSLGTIDLALTRRRALSPADRIGTLVTLSGGPGQSGIELARSLVSAWNPTRGELLRRFDLVGVDVRGTAASGPIVRCVDDATRAMLEALAASAASEDDFDALLRQAIAGCATAIDPAVLPHLDTASVARDLDRLRAALGEDRLSLFGVSYGTKVEAAYATMFPSHVRAAVLVSSVAGTTDAFERARIVAQGSQEALDRFLAWCDATATCAFHPASGTSMQALDALADALHAHPLTDTSGGRTRTLTDVALASALRSMLYAPDLAAIGRALAAARDGTPGPLLDVIDGALARQQPWGDVPAIIGANDDTLPAGATRDTWFAYHAARIAPVAPFFARVDSVRSLAVRLRLLWPYHPDDRLASYAAPTAPPLLIVVGTADPVTPVAAARSMAATLANGSVVVESDRPGHGSDDGPCLAARETAYLLAPAAPIDGSRCPQAPVVAPDDTVVATATASFPRTVADLRIGEAAIGDLVTDAMLAAAAADGAQVAMINSGGLQSGLPSAYVPAAPGLRRPPAAPPYDLVVEDTRRVLRFGNRLALTTVSGATLRAFLEYSLAGWNPQGTGAASSFVQLAGLHVTFSTSASPGMRVQALTLADGTAIDDAATYRIAVPDFVLYGGTGTDLLAAHAPTLGASLDVVLADYLRARGAVSPATDGRITTAP